MRTQPTSKQLAQLEPAVCHVGTNHPSSRKYVAVDGVANTDADTPGDSGASIAAMAAAPPAMQDATEDLLGTSAPDAPDMDERATPTQRPYNDTAVQQLVPSHVTAVWAGSVAEALECIRDAVKRGHRASVVTGVQHLLTLASEVLGNNRGGKGQSRRAAARVRDLHKRTRAAITLADSGGPHAGRSK